MISSVHNEQIKSLIQLQKHARARRQEDVFLVEGDRMLKEAPPEQLLRLYCSETYYKKKNGQVPYLAEKRLEVLTDSVFDHVSDTETPQGILGVVRQNHYELEELLKRPEKKLFVVLETIQNPGNLGTILRAGEGAGITGVILSKDCADVYNPKTVRGSMGSIFRVPYIYVESIPEILKKMSEKYGITTFASTLEGAQNYDEFDFCGDSAILIGNEGNGLKNETIICANYRIKVPMLGQVESLNASIATAIMLYEASRQRRG